MNQKPTQYIGATDFQTEQQVHHVLQFVPPASNIKLHVGLMTSCKKLKGEATQFDRVWLQPSQLSETFINHPQVMNCIHLAGSGKEDVFNAITQIIALGGKNLHAIQLDMTWPNPGQVISAVRDANKPGLEVILQIGVPAYEKVRGNCQEQTIENFLRALEPYQGVLTHVLFDMSMGRGEPMDIEFLRPLIQAVHERFPEMGKVAGGGLGPKTYHLAKPVREEFPFMSFDAQGQLRPSKDCRDPLNIEWTCQYVEGMYGLMTHEPLLV